MILTDVNVTDLDEVLELNEASVPHLSSIDSEQLRWFTEHAAYFRVVRRADALVGFLIGLRPGLAYTSPNYQWFARHYDDFAYIDRVATHPSARRLGVASMLYDDFADQLGDEVAVLTCEVNLRPRNDASMLYHQQHGFVAVAAQETEGGTKKVALMERRL